MHITKITFFSATNGNFVMNSTIRYTDMSTASLVFHLPLTFLLVLLSYSSFSSINYNYPHTFLHLLLLPATNNFLLPTPLSFITLYILLPVYHDVSRLSLLTTSYPLAYKFFLLSIPTFLLSITHYFSILLLPPSLSLLLL